MEGSSIKTYRDTYAAHIFYSHDKIAIYTFRIENSSVCLCWTFCSWTETIREAQDPNPMPIWASSNLGKYTFKE